MNRYPLAVLMVGMAASGATAQWTMVTLSRDARPHDTARAVWGNQQVGGHWYPGRRALLWTGSADSGVTLGQGSALGIYAGQQVGVMSSPGGGRAGLWMSTPESWVDLHPAVATTSEAAGVWAGCQVGVAQLGAARHASLWRGSAESWVDLHPSAQLAASQAFGVWADEQVGFTQAHGGREHAALWNGTPQSWVDLHPPGAVASWAYGAHDGQQAGVVNLPLLNGHAALWTGTAGSWVDLNPPGASGSEAFGVFAGQQVGQVDGYAAIWAGTPESVQFLDGPHFQGGVHSTAYGIWSDENHTYVVGQGGGWYSWAVMWIGPPPCRADFNRNGAVDSGDLFEFLGELLEQAPRADFNDDGVGNSQDFFDFLRAFFAGCK